ncbi:MAG TPA: hypothetical protein VFO85_06580, partial [Vicinamibacteria bacterium]|nr:hypothetical protein [Vicinamibacteria bacterium]
MLALATVAAARRLTLLAWTSVCALAGASGGAKQIVPLLAGGLILWLARQAWRQGGVRWMAAGCAAAAVAALTWIVPLSINCGSFRVYVQHALQQIAWQRHHDAVAFEGAPSRVLDRLAAAFAPAAHPPGLALALWLLAALGAVAAGRDHRLRWMLWLLAPLLLVRVLLLGPAPRFTIYYVPFVIALAVHGFAAVTRRLPRAGQRMAMAAAVSAWVAIQTHHVLPLLLALHEGPAPLESAVQTVRARMPVTDTLLLGSGGVLGRHLAYYAERHGLRSLEEDGEPRPATRVVQIAGSTQRPRTSWAWGGEPVGRWSLAVPNAQEVGPTGFVWDVTAVELHGPQVALRHWRVDAAGRRFATDTSRIVVFRPPGEDFGLRLQGRARGPVFFSIAGHRV